MRATVFVDTNVLLYARDASQGVRHHQAREWLALLWREQCGRTSIQVLDEYYVNMTRKLRPAVSRDLAWQAVQALLAWDPRPIDATLLELARAIEERHRIDWWDSLIVAAAQAEGCSLLLTEDLQDGAQYASITVRNPFRSTIAEPNAAYDHTMAPLSRHRGRGRPPKRPASMA